MGDGIPAQTWDQGIDKEFQDVFPDIESNEVKTSPGQKEREKRLGKKQRILEQMQSEQEIDRKIRGLQKEKSKKPQRSASTKVTKRISLSGNPNGGSGSEGEQDTNMNKRMVHCDGESQPEKRNRSEKKGGAKAYGPPSNRNVRKYQNLQGYETGFIGDKEKTGRNETKDGKGSYGKQKGEKAMGKG